MPSMAWRAALLSLLQGLPDILQQFMTCIEAAISDPIRAVAQLLCRGITLPAGRFDADARLHPAATESTAAEHVRACI